MLNKYIFNYEKLNAFTDAELNEYGKSIQDGKVNDPFFGSEVFARHWSGGMCDLSAALVYEGFKDLAEELNVIYELTDEIAGTVYENVDEFYTVYRDVVPNLAVWRYIVEDDTINDDIEGISTCEFWRDCFMEVLGNNLKGDEMMQLLKKQSNANIFAHRLLTKAKRAENMSPCLKKVLTVYLFNI